MKRCLFGGSFDPVHMGHFSIADKARKECGLDEVVFLPCAQSPLKEQKPMFSDAERLRMLELSLSGLAWTCLDTLDLKLPPPSWSWRIAEHFNQANEGDDLYWLMGVDQWNDLERWGRWEYLASMVCFIVHSREKETPVDRAGTRAFFIHGEHPASSSEIRRRLTDGVDIPHGWLNEEVSEYLRREKGFFRSFNT